MNKKNCKNQIEDNKMREADEEILEMTASMELARLREETNAIREATKIEEEIFEKKSELLNNLTEMIASMKLARLREETNAIREATKIEEEIFEKKSELLNELTEMLEHSKRHSLRERVQLDKIHELIEKCDAHFRSIYEYLDRKM